MGPALCPGTGIQSSDLFDRDIAELRDRKTSPQMDDNPAINHFCKVFPAFLEGFSRGPYPGKVGNFPVIRLFIINDLIPGPGPCSLNVFHDHEVSLLPLPDSDRRYALIRYFLLVADLQEQVKRVTAPYQYPRAIEFVTSLPKTHPGKIRRHELREREERKAKGRGEHR